MELSFHHGEHKWKWVDHGRNAISLCSSEQGLVDILKKVFLLLLCTLWHFSKTSNGWVFLIIFTSYLFFFLPVMVVSLGRGLMKIFTSPFQKWNRWCGVSSIHSECWSSAIKPSSGSKGTFYILGKTEGRF